MDFVAWLKQSPFATPWFDLLLAGVLIFEILPFFIRARAARAAFTAASVSCQLALLVCCLFFGTTLTEALLVLAVVALISSASAYAEYRLFDRDEVTAECEAKAEEAKRVAEERAARFVLPLSDQDVSDENREGGDEE
ncbi:MAG: hypothetical protein J5958_04350 [Clostridia bacterium]|nr:hypothetical protein [Clostridia bacterium]MBR5044284.1 hypothetical protein [Clostridia bacterium]